jgi:hypothetical protein
VGIVIPLFLVLIIIPLYFANRPGVTESEMLWIMGVPMGLFLLIIVGGVPLAMVYTIRRRSSWLDAIFELYRLEGKSYALTGRQYHGKVHGRDVDVYYTRGPQLNIYVTTEVNTRLMVSAEEDVSRGVAGFLNRVPVEFDTQSMEGFVVFAHEEGWARDFLSEPEVLSLLQDIIQEENNFLYKQVYLNPGAFGLRLYRSNQMWGHSIEPEQGKAWMEKLIRLAELAERMPAPQEALEEGALENKVRTGTFKPGRTTAIILMIAVAISLCIGLVILGILLLLVN